MLTKEQKEFFSKSEYGFRLEDRHFVAVFKTRLLKYKDYVVPEHNCGNIVSYTGIFAAVDKADAEQKALSHFHCWNPTFSPLKRECMKVEHTLIEVKEIIPPEPKGDFRHIHQLIYSPASWWSHLHIKVHALKELPMPEPVSEFLDTKTFWIRRIQKHLDSKTAEAYLCHPWGGAGDNGADWWHIPKGDRQFEKMAELFVAHHRFFSNQFEHTEYTDLSVSEQELVKNRLKLDSLDKQHAHYSGQDEFAKHDLAQGRYFVQKTYSGEITDILFREDESNWLRHCYIKGNDRKIELRKKLQDLERQRSLLNSEIKNVKKSLAEE
jgi:hypothetical protein